MPTDKKLNQLIQNILTKEQYDSTSKNPDEQYFITDDDYFATKTDLAGKQNTISDLSTIRTNASSAKSTVDTHVANGTIHVTAQDKVAWSQKQNKLTAGANITIDETTNTISASGGLAEVSWGGITGTLSNQTDLKNALDGKQPTGDYATKSELPTKTSDLENDSNYITSSYHDNTKQDTISDLSTIRTNAQAGKSASDTISNYGDIVTHDADEFQPAGDYATNTRVNEVEGAIPTNNNQLTNGAGYITASYHDSTKQDVITDLDDIRNGASLGATALQSYTETDPTVPAHVKSITSANISSWNNKQEAISDLSTIRTNATAGKSASDTISGYGDIVTHNANEFQLAGDYATNTALTQGLAGKQDTISDLATIRSNASTGAGLAPQVASNTQRIEDLTVSKFPNATPIGQPTVQDSYVSNFSATTYMQFPFTDISRGLPFDIYFSFTTSDDVTTQQNILDSYFGIALAIQNGKGIMALSSNGTNWDIGTSTGTNTLLPRTTYYAKYSWTGTEYNTSLSLDNQTYVPDMRLTSSLSPHKTTIYIGGSPNLFGPNTAHPFKGTINFKGARVYLPTLDITVWEGMADVGLASRANVSLNNLDEAGEAKFNAKQDIITDLSTIRDGASKGATALQSIPSEYVTESELSAYHDATKQDVINDLSTIRSNASAGKSASDTIASYGNIVTHNANEFQVAGDYITPTQLSSFERITKNGFTGSGSPIKYLELGKLPIDNAGNYCSLIIEGRLGGWVNSNMAYYNIMLSNRADYTGDIITSAVYSSVNVNQIETDIVIYKQDDKSAKIYLKCRGYYTFDFTYKTFQSTITYDGTELTTEPSGTMIWQLSTAKKLKLSKTNELTVDKVIADLTGTASKATADASGNVITSTYATKTELNNKMDKVTLAKVATSGSYNDLSDTPSIPSEVTENTVAGWGFTKNTGTYSKPTGGIPKTDLTNAVQTSLGLADTALQGITSSDVTSALGYTPYNATNPNGYTSNKGTVTKVNNTSPDAEGNVSITIPTVNNATLTIQKNGNNVATFTANSSSNATANITVPTKVSELTNDSGFTSNTGTVTSVNNVAPVNGNVTLSIPTVTDTYSATSSNAMSGKAVASAISGKADTSALAKVATSGSYSDLSDKPTIPTVTDTYSATSTSAMSGKAVASAISNKMDKVTLATVATSGSYNDLSDKPSIPSAVTETTVSGWGFTKNAGTVTTVNNLAPVNGNVTLSIPSAVTESTVSGWGFTKNTGTYSKPSTGIPKTDLANDVQTSLGKADTALQSFTETDPTVPAHVKSITEANISTWNGKQATLVSGTNIKTINGESVLGDGNLAIEAGASIDYLTQEEYEARKEAGTLDENKYYSTPNDVSLQILEILYPVGSLYLTTASTCPLATLGIGTWQLEATDRVLQGAGSRGAVGTTIDESLPNITGSGIGGADLGATGAFRNYQYDGGIAGGSTGHKLDFDASRSSSTYQDGAPVQQDAYLINVFRRIA